MTDDLAKDRAPAPPDLPRAVRGIGRVFAVVAGALTMLLMLLTVERLQPRRQFLPPLLCGLIHLRPQDAAEFLVQEHRAADPAQFTHPQQPLGGCTPLCPRPHKQQFLLGREVRGQPLAGFVQCCCGNLGLAR